MAGCVRKFFQVLWSRRLACVSSELFKQSQEASDYWYMLCSMQIVSRYKRQLSELFEHLFFIGFYLLVVRNDNNNFWNCLPRDESPWMVAASAQKTQTKLFLFIAKPCWAGNNFLSSSKTIYKLKEYFLHVFAVEWNNFSNWANFLIAIKAEIWKFAVDLWILWFLVSGSNFSIHAGKACNSAINLSKHCLRDFNTKRFSWQGINN